MTSRASWSRPIRLFSLEKGAAMLHRALIMAQNSVLWPQWHANHACGLNMQPAGLPRFIGRRLALFSPVRAFAYWEGNTKNFNHFTSFLLIVHPARDMREEPDRSLIINYFRHAFSC